MLLRRRHIGWLTQSLAVCAACLLLGSAGQARAEDPEELARQLAQQALAHEASGDLAGRDNALEAALQLDPNCETARWKLGFLRVDDEWVSTAESAARLTADPLREKYRTYRAEFAQTVAGQLTLADWCLNNGLPDQARAHLTCVLELDPDEVTARALLGYVPFRGAWFLASDILEAQQLYVQQQQANIAWEPKLKGIRKQLSRPQTREAGLQRLAAIDDPLAIPAIEATLLEGSAADDAIVTAALEAISSLPQCQAAQALARQSLDSASEDVRERALALLAQRRLDEYVPMLLSRMEFPLASATSLWVAPGGDLLYRHVIAREHAEWRELLVLDKNLLMDRRPNQSMQRVQEAGVGAAVLQAAQREAAIARENAATAARNERVVHVLQTATGVALGNDAQRWNTWWNEENGIALEGEKPVYSNYGSENAVIRRCECLKAGTLIHTDRGLVPVEQIQAGDSVLSQDLVTGELAYKPVLRPTTRPTSQLIKIVTDTITLESSEGHPFWVQGEGWVVARQLKAGAKLQGERQPATVQIVEPTNQEVTYNLIVADFHTYFIGEERVLSHDNTPCKPSNAAIPGLAKSR